MQWKTQTIHIPKWTAKPSCDQNFCSFLWERGSWVTAGFARSKHGGKHHLQGKTKSFKTFKSSCLGKRYQILLVIWSMQGFFFWPFKLPLIKIIPHNTCPWVLLLDLSISGACLHYSSTLKRTARGILKNLIVRLKKDGKALREVSALLEISRNICSRNQELQNEPQHH